MAPLLHRAAINREMLFRMWAAKFVRPRSAELCEQCKVRPSLTLVMTANNQRSLQWLHHFSHSENSLIE